jgi:hypothetical protein
MSVGLSAVRLFSNGEIGCDRSWRHRDSDQRHDKTDVVNADRFIVSLLLQFFIKL